MHRSWIALVGGLALLNGAVESAIASSLEFRTAPLDTTMDSYIRLDSTFIRKLRQVYDSSIELSRRGPHAWRYVTGGWVGTGGYDTINVVTDSSGELTEFEIDFRVREIENTPAIRELLRAARWDVTEYVVTIRAVASAALLVSIERRQGSEAMERWAYRYGIRVRPDVMEYVRMNGQLLRELGFVRAAEQMRFGPPRDGRQIKNAPLWA